MKPSRKPSWRVVTQRFASAIVALPSPPPAGITWSSSSSSSVPDELAERRDVGPDPAGPVDDARALDDARQLRPEGFGEARDDPRHRGRVLRLRGAQLVGGQRPRRRPQAADRDPLGLRPVDEALAGGLLGAPAEDRRRGTQRRPDDEPGLPDAVVAPRLLRRAAAAARRLAAARPLTSAPR